MIYNVTVQTEITMVVVADDMDHAYDVAEYHMHEALRESSSKPFVMVDGEVTSLDKLRDGWDGMCCPWGGDGNTRLKDLLPAASGEPAKGEK